MFKVGDPVTIARHIEIDSKGRHCIPAWPNAIGQHATVVAIDEHPEDGEDGADVAVSAHVGGTMHTFWMSGESLDAGHTPPPEPKRGIFRRAIVGACKAILRAMER